MTHGFDTQEPLPVASDPLSFLSKTVDWTKLGRKTPDPNKVKRRLFSKLEGTTDDYVLTIDNSSMEKLLTCPRSAEYYLLRRQERPPTSALIFGGAMHEALAEHYREAEPHQAAAKIDEYFQENPPASVDYRTVSFGRDVFAKYRQNYLSEPFQIAEIDGRLAVEIAFRVPIGKRKIDAVIPMGQDLLVEDGVPGKPLNVGTIHFLWSGRIDMIVIDPDGNWWVLDHKTSSVFGQTFFDQFKLSQQMLGYTFAGNHLTGRQLKGLWLNALICRKPTRTGKGVEFHRQRFFYTKEQVEEFRRDIMSIADGFLNFLLAGYLPKETVWCVGKYGKCPYHDVCSMPPKDRMAILHGPTYDPVTWSPLD